MIVNYEAHRYEPFNIDSDKNSIFHYSQFIDRTSELVNIKRKKIYRPLWLFLR